MKNKKGFFLAEAIVMTSIVALTITLIFPQFANRYERMKARLVSYNRAPDVYAANYIDENIETLGSGMGCTSGTAHYVYTFDSPSYNVTKIIQSTSIANIKTYYTDADINLKKFLNNIEEPPAGQVVLIFEFQFVTDGPKRYTVLYRSSGFDDDIVGCTL